MTSFILPLSLKFIYRSCLPKQLHFFCNDITKIIGKKGNRQEKLSGFDPFFRKILPIEGICTQNPLFAY